MKQSNWILGLGILVAALLIAGSLYLQAEPLSSRNASLSTPNSPSSKNFIRKLSVKPVIEISESFVRILSRR